MGLPNSVFSVIIACGCDYQQGTKNVSWHWIFLLRRWNSLIIKYTLFYRQPFFSTQPQCCLTFSWIELQMLLRCCLTIIILRHILYILYLCPCLGLDLLMSYLCDLSFIFSLVFIVIYFTNHITSLKQAPLAFLQFLKYLLLIWMIR